ncbi:hypothetical protein BVY00_01690, partial [bacterium G20]
MESSRPVCPAKTLYTTKVEDTQLENRVYDLQWFQNRAFASLKKIDNGVWDFSDSVLLYTPDAEKKYETIQQTDNAYYQEVTRPERDYLKKVASDIAESLPDKFEYIDLGPGTEHKEQFFFDELKKQNKDFIYKPVDINERFLRMATEYADKQGLPVAPLLSPFEELPVRLDGFDNMRFVSLGLTYANYSPGEILPLLKSIAANKGQVFIDVQIRDRINLKVITDIYSRNVYTISEPKLKLLG